MNDNQTYSSLGFQALLILNRLRTKMDLLEMSKGTEDKKPEAPEPAHEGDKADKREAEHAEAVDSRLRDFAKFEKRYGRK